MGESMIRGRRKNFTTIYNSVLQDRRLTLKTIGLFAIMQSFPDDWEYSISGLAARAGIGRDSIRKCLKELEDAGYLLREQGHQDNGKFACNTYVLQDEAPPCTEKPYTVKPSTAKPLTENRPQVNKHFSKETSSKPPISPQGEDTWELFEEFYKAYPRHQKKPQAKKAWDKLAPDLALYRKMAAALEQFKASRQWCKDQGQYIPLPASWLNGRCWEDDPGPMYKPSQPPPVPAEDEQGGRYL
ncbi:helix-turn-helix domain-containing protein [uncultured Dysosmobacter sp.]|uniref:helix-turn-helix domain-containing protein n=1 Tax=uncultured Dysosmobacter sp. TaxID=2591384 RepID=UPI002630BF71|nr:helix-turn-helix domain-containing protein [uncultured Dysosmobacter sp.]